MEPLIVYIIGDNRSGSTLLDYLLSCHPDAVSVGELHHLHDYYCKMGYGIRTNWKCSCGEQLAECSFWGNVMKRIGISNGFKTRLECRESKWSFLLHNWQEKSIYNVIKNSRVNKTGEKFSENYWEVYNTVREVSGKQIIIDSSKNAYEAYFLNKTKKGYKILFLLLERQLRAVSYSKLNRVGDFNKDMKSYLHLTNRSIYSYLINSYKVLWRNRILSKMISSYTPSSSSNVKRIDYEELCCNTNEVISSIITFLKIDHFTPPLATGLCIEKNHMIHGSPSRKENREIKIDERWRDYYSDRPLANSLGRLLEEI